MDIMVIFPVIYDLEGLAYPVDLAENVCVL